MLKGILNIPAKIILTILSYILKILACALFVSAVKFILQIFPTVINDIFTSVTIYVFFAAALYLQRTKNARLEKAYTATLTESPPFNSKKEWRSVIKTEALTLIIDTVIWYAAITFIIIFPTPLADMIQTKLVLIIFAAIGYIAAPLTDIMIFIKVHKAWHTKYMRWAKRKQTQQFDVSDKGDYHNA